MKYILLTTILLSSVLFSEVTQEDVSSEKTTQVLDEKQDEKQQEDSLEPTVIKDTSGLSDEEIREVANQTDKTDKKVKAKDVIKTIVESDSKGNVDISKLQSPWEELSPTPKKYDWIQTKSKEWFKGYIKTLYKDSLEFDSDEIGLYTFDFDDIKQIKSYQILTVNIEDLALVRGIVRFKDDKITIIQGDTKYEFNRNQIISFASEGEKERDVWSGKITISLDKRDGNTKSFDYSAKADIKRRTAKTNLQLNYLGRISSKNDTQTANDHLVNEKFDSYITRHFYWTPLFSEYYKNTYKNIQARYRAGAGAGYIFLDTADAEWDISAGPAYMYTEYVSVQEGKDIISSSLALEVSTNLEWKLNSKMDLEYLYLLTWSNDSTGAYSHHMMLTLENEITSWLDFDISAIWDYTLMPQEKENGEIPLRDDFQFLIGLGIEF
jgi:hypothetical protein